MSQNDTWFTDSRLNSLLWDGMELCQLGSDDALSAQRFEWLKQIIENLSIRIDRNELTARDLDKDIRSEILLLRNDISTLQREYAVNHQAKVNGSDMQKQITQAINSRIDQIEIASKESDREIRELLPTKTNHTRKNVLWVAGITIGINIIGNLDKIVHILSNMVK